MAASTLSLGMLRARAFWMTRRSEGLLCGFDTAALTAIVISLPMRANALDILSQRANIVAFRVSKMRPILILAGDCRMRFGVGNAARVGHHASGGKRAHNILQIQHLA